MEGPARSSYRTTATPTARDARSFPSNEAHVSRLRASLGSLCGLAVRVVSQQTRLAVRETGQLLWAHLEYCSEAASVEKMALFARFAVGVETIEHLVGN